MTEVTEVGEPAHKGLLLGRVLFGHTQKKNHKRPLTLRPASTFFLSFFLFCFEMSVLRGAILILFHSV